MRYTGTTRARGNGEQVWEFVLGKEELRILADLLTHYVSRIPLTLETQTLRERIKNMLTEIKTVLRTGHGKHPEPPTQKNHHDQD